MHHDPHTAWQTVAARVDSGSSLVEFTRLANCDVWYRTPVCEVTPRARSRPSVEGRLGFVAVAVVVAVSVAVGVGVVFLDFGV